MQVYALPSSGFSSNSDTIWYEQSYLLEATPGYANYQWSTGDTAYYINVNAEGKYSIFIETAEGCTASADIMMLDAFVPVQVPKAFTSNNDGLNDTFKPIVSTELVRRYTSQSTTSGVSDFLKH